MKLTFYGAAGEVTGSCTLLESGGFKLLVDCGAFQGGRRERMKNNKRFPFNAKKVSALVLTHAHYDHCGRIPKLVAEGFTGPIFTTEATAHLMRLVLEDSLHVMESDYQNTGVLPFFTPEHLHQAMSQIKTIKYNQKINLQADGKNNSSVIFRDAGHILGSSSIEVNVEGPSTGLGTSRKTILFSGDLGNDDAPIIADTHIPEKADVVVMESTYAMREHEPLGERHAKLEEALKRTAENHGVLLIPSFAIERTQELLWDLHKLSDKNKLPNMKFYLDSPLAIKVTQDFKHHADVYDEEAAKAYKNKHDFLDFPNLILTPTSTESKQINMAPAPKVIIAGAGMMDGGRITFHLQRYLPLANTTILVIGYQAEHTTGRKILRGEKEVPIFGRFVPVHAKIVKANSYSAHADYKKLVRWLTSIKEQPQTVFLNHGEWPVIKEFADYLHAKHGLNTVVPKEKQTFNI